MKTRVKDIAKKINIGTTSILEFLEKNLNQPDKTINSKLTREEIISIISHFVKDKYQKEEYLKEFTEEKKQVKKPKEPVKTEEQPKETEPEKIIDSKEEAQKIVTGPKIIDKTEIKKDKSEKQKAVQTVKEETKEESKPVQEVEKQEVSEKKKEEYVKEEVSEEKEIKAGEEATKLKEESTEKQSAQELKQPDKQEVKEVEKTSVEVVAEEKEETSKEEKNSEIAEMAEQPETKQEQEEVAEENLATSSSKDMLGPKILGKIDLSKVSDNRPKKTPKEKSSKSKKDKHEDKKEKAKDKKSKKDFKRDKHKDKKHKKGRYEKNKKGQIAEKVNIEAEKNKNYFKKKDKRQKEELKEIKDSEVTKKIKETNIKLQQKDKSKAQQRKLKLQKKEKIRERISREQATEEKIKVPEFIKVGDLAKLINKDVNEILSLLFDMGYNATVNFLLDPPAIELVLDEFGIPYEIDKETFEEKIEKIIREDAESEDSVVRPPIVTVMGHVDHGKTTLLDYIRNTRVVDTEKGGITQHIGAYHVVLEEYKGLLDSNIHSITFIDTPGHEAFTAMRAKGAKITDIAIIVVAADDSVMPTTIEAIDHAKAADIPMIFAINKIDKPNADPQKVKQQLLEHGILLEDFGGPYPSVEISAKTGQNVDKLLELILLQAEILELKANPNRNAIATVIESKVEKGKGALANVIVRTGTLKKGDPIWSGPYFGKVRAMFNEKGERVKEAGPSIPVQVMGLNGAPIPGEPLIVEDSEAQARKLAQERDKELREISKKRTFSLEEISKMLAESEEKIIFPVIIKADVNGSIDAISDALYKFNSDDIEIKIIRAAVGQITENDVVLASASKAIIIGFNIRPSSEARKKAEQLGVEIRLYSIIYEIIDDIEAALKGMLKPKEEEKILGTAEVLQTFKISKVGTVAGCIVRDGKILRNANVRVIRDGVVVYDGKIASLRRFDKDVNEVAKGYECGIRIDGFNDVKKQDVIEAYEKVLVEAE